MAAHASPAPPRRDPGATKPEPHSPQPPQARHLHRERDFGIGYGNSSGYGREEHFARPPWGPERFRCV
jgi:hypothetical protein